MTNTTRLLHLLDHADHDTLDLLALLLQRLRPDRFQQTVVLLDPPDLKAARRRLGQDVQLLPQRFGLAVSIAPPLRRLVRQRRVTLLHAWGRLSATASRMACPQLPLCVTIQRYASHAKLTKWLSTLSDHPRLVLVASSGTLRRALLAAGADPQRCALIRPAIDFVRLSQARRPAIRRELALPDGAPTLLTPAPPTRPGGHYYALWAAGLLQQLLNDLRIILPGASPQRHRLLRFAENFNRRQMVLAPPHDRHFADLLAAADVLLAPAVGNVPTNALAWAMAAGLPIVASAVPAITEIITSGRNGLLARPATTMELTAHVLSLFHDQQLRRRLTDAARNHAHQLFSPAHCLQNYLRLYNNLLSGRQPTASLQHAPANP